MTTDAARPGEVDEELRQLIRSLDDLDAELAAGDIDPDDYETLRNDYTVRVADAVRRSGDPAAMTGPRSGSLEPEVASEPAAADAGINRWLIIAALGLFAVGAGWLLARSAGERGIGEALTGSIDRSARQRVAECQSTGTTDGDLLGAIQCFDEVLTTDPDNVEALTYRAWFLVLAATGGAAADTTEATAQEVELLEAARVYLDQAIEVDPLYPDARAFRTVVADRLGDSDEVCRQVVALIETDPPPFFLEQTLPVAERNGCEPT